MLASDRVPRRTEGDLALEENFTFWEIFFEKGNFGKINF
jgi:hypothetical protein